MQQAITRKPSTRILSTGGILLTIACASLGLVLLSGCQIIWDGLKRDCQSAKQIPQAISEGAKQDLANYKKTP